MKRACIFYFGTLFIFFLSFSCKTEAEPLVLNMTVKEASQNLKKGDIAFILEASPLQMREIARIHPSAPFYAGLLAKAQESPPKLRAIGLFEAALDVPAEKTQENAALELIHFVLENAETAKRILKVIDQNPQNKEKPAGGIETLRAASLYSLAEFDQARSAASLGENLWARAIYFLSSLKSADTFSREWHDFLLAFLLMETVEDAHLWAYRAIPDKKIFSDTENAVIEGHFLTSKKSYREAIKHFHTVIERDYMFFLKNPIILSDLGRCFQYTNSAAGVKYFTEWEKQIQERVRTKKETENVSLIRYNLLFYTGRMERQRSHWKEASGFFKDALLFAPDEKQEDACIWYILNMEFKHEPENIVPFLRIYAPLWNENDYFSDILGEVCQNFAAKHNWNKILEIFSLIRKKHGEIRAENAITAQYAYIVGRCLLEGYIPGAEVAAYMGTDGDARTFFRIAFENTRASFYYRALSAFYLGENVSITKSEEKKKEVSDFLHKEDMDFLLGFFEFGAASYAFPYIDKVKENLTQPELHALAESMSNNELWYESIRFISAYKGRSDYKEDYSDLPLFYPRPFYDIIEKYAEIADIPESLLFGLIRTESAFKAEAVSSAGAAGLTQLMRATARETAESIRRGGGKNYFDTEFKIDDPETNVHIGSYYLRHLIDRADNPMFAVLGYNGGPNRIRRFRSAESSLPEDLFLETVSITETREYGKRVSSAAAAYGYLYYNVSMEKTLADIFIIKKIIKQVP